MAPSQEYNDDLLLLLATLLVADHTNVDSDDLEPFLDPLLRTLEERLFERSELFSRLPFPPHFIFARLRSSLRRGSLGRRTKGMQEIGDSIYGRLSERLDRIERETDRRFAEVRERLNDLSFEDEITRHNVLLSLSDVADDLKTFEWGLSIGIKPEELRTQRTIPIRIYLSEPAGDETHQAIIDAVVATLGELSFEKDTDLPEESGSWWKRFWARTKDMATQEDVAERLQKLERAAEIALLDKPQAAANKDHATAIATLMKALNNSDKACIQAGNILLLKNGDDIIVRTLSPVELRAVEKNQALLKQPQSLLRKLQTICEEAEEPEASSAPQKPNRLILPRRPSKPEKNDT
ncbi:hypothetical protein GA0061099_1004372 [Bradyrhizobium yuanmingense]|uniref:Uncharacterized protein n=1 Tax=Bradyrhizobium yuanmingense TaxID=108015 RepID=A0A1C3VPR8_9BRAD|nr:hypothetical protein [Bradyrhizobium yuanmingense]TWI28785.1 hypothetical protein IQ15_02131 [Bradyrhizobium yuanmingense]SCB29793.1 hypothetical protein GA0061099_1004372 [Bradyrhizobium yuanmingense]